MDASSRILRPFRAEDAPALAALYRRAVERTGAECYSPRQVAAWARTVEAEELGRRLAAGGAIVGLCDGVPVAFGQLHPRHTVAFLYTAPEANRQGWASAIYAALEREARRHGVPVLDTKASHLSQPFFQKVGFEVVEQEIVCLHGVDIPRFVMRNVLEPSL